MKHVFVYSLLFALSAVSAPHAQSVSGGGAFALPEEMPMSAEQQAYIEAQIQQNRASLRAAGILNEASSHAEVAFEWPLRAVDDLDDYGYHGTSFFVDQDPDFGELSDYLCEVRTYDVPGYNHSGTDFFTWPYGWAKMDNEDVEVVAAAAGVILFKSDGNPDRNCEFGDGDWNAVYVEHADGSVAWYGHLKNGSTTPKEVGESVEVGERLGIVGSSGNSTGPHLHLEIRDADDNLIDPYEGACNELNETSWWAEQPPYFDSAINAVMTHGGAPSLPTCPNTQDDVQAKDAFDPGDLVYVAGYYRDQRAGQLSTYTVRRPDGSVWQEWTNVSSQPHFAASYWWWLRTLPVDAETGTWVVEVSYEGETYLHEFTVGMTTANEESIESGSFALSGVYPNPVDATGYVTLSLGESQSVRVVLYDMLGREVAVVHDGPLAAGGEVRLALDRVGLPSGLYVVRAVGARATAVRSFVVQR